jgi:transglutaminase-like putative cysteine protease
VLRLTTDAQTPEYLKLVTLDVYDGTVWRTADRPVPESQRIDEGLPSPPGLSPDVATTAVSYQVEVSEALQSQWLPLPYPAQAVTTASGDWRYDAQTLDVVATDRSTQGLRYDLTALEVSPTGSQLDGAAAVPGRLDEMLALPDDLDPSVVDLAREVTAQATSDYERAVALQQWFREDGGFSYDLSVAPGNAEDDLVAFLQERRGYCEQYAATMAIMARVLGIPARVGVGYLRGEQPQPGLWVVRAQDAHAWPELFFEGVGWLRFEPTPSTRTGEPPVCITFGSMINQKAGQIHNSVLSALARQGKRAVVLTGWGGSPGKNTPHCLYLDSAPHSWLLPRCQAVLHHGGARQGSRLLSLHSR